MQKYFEHLHIFKCIFSEYDTLHKNLILLSFLYIPMYVLRKLYKLKFKINVETYAGVVRYKFDYISYSLYLKYLFYQ